MPTNGWSVEGSTINGAAVTVGTIFKDAVIAAAQAAHYTNFRVFVNGSELDVKDAPAVVGAGLTIEVRPYDKAGRAS